MGVVAPCGGWPAGVTYDLIDGRRALRFEHFDQGGLLWCPARLVRAFGCTSGSMGCPMRGPLYRHVRRARRRGVRFPQGLDGPEWAGGKWPCTSVADQAVGRPLAVGRFFAPDGGSPSGACLTISTSSEGTAWRRAVAGGTTLGRRPAPRIAFVSWRAPPGAAGAIAHDSASWLRHAGQARGFRAQIHCSWVVREGLGHGGRSSLFRRVAPDSAGPFYFPTPPGGAGRSSGGR